MSWALAAQVGIGALSSWLGSRADKYIAKGQQYQQESQAYLGGISQIKQLSKMLDVQGKQNESLLKADNQNFVNTQYQSGLMGLQDALSRKVAARNMSITKRGGAVELAQNVANAAAAGTIGSSVQAVSQDVQRNVDKGLNDIEQQRELERNQHYVGVYSLYTNYHQSQQQIDDSLPDVPESPRIYQGHIPKNSFGNHLLGSALNVGMGLLADNISLGLGSKSTTPTKTPTTTGGSVKLYGLKA